MRDTGSGARERDAACGPAVAGARPGAGAQRAWSSRGSYQAAPLPVKILIAIAGIAACIPFAAVIVIWMLAFAPYAVWTGRTQWWATASATMWGIALVATQAHGHTSPHYA